MKKLFVVLICFVLVGCGHTSKIASKMDANIGDTLEESCTIGIPAADKIIKAWPYVSGQIKGLYSKDYEDALPNSIKFIVSKLDGFATKSNLSDEEKGLVNGYIIRLDALFIERGYNRGISIHDMIIKYTTGL